MRDYSFRRFATTFILASGMFLGAQGQGLAATNVVNEIAPKDTLTPGVWEANDVRTGGEASIVDLTGLGGNLETNQPLPVGAALLTTNFTNEAKAEIGVYNDYGLAREIIPSLQLAFDYLKAANPGQNASASPSIKLTFYNPVCEDADSGGDCYGTLVWEAYWQGANPPVDTWTAASIDQNNGSFWWTGGFGFPNGGGGGTMNTLAGWLASFSSDFPGASLILVSVGVGSYGQGQIGYFDNVSISHSAGDGFSEVYDFEPIIDPSSPIPTMATWSVVLLVLLLAAAGIGVQHRRRS